MRFLIGLAVLALAACGEEPAPPPAVEPTGFTILPAHLWKPTPNDICRVMNPSFLDDLTARIRGALPPHALQGFEFRNFNVSDFGGRGLEATYRFRATSADASQVYMIAVGPIDPDTCIIGEMQLAEGGSLATMDTANAITVP